MSGRWVQPLRRAALVALCVGLALSWWRMASTAHFAINVMLSYGAVWAIAWLAARPQNRRRIAYSFVLVTALAAPFELLMEFPALVGWIDYRVALGTPILDPAEHPAYVVDEELVFRRRPYEHFEGSLRGGDMSFVYDVPDGDMHHYDVRYDGNGFRNAEDLSRASVVVVGDSFVEGAYVLDSELLTSVMSRELGTAVANLGVIAYGPQQELAVLRRYALPLEPDIVFWIFFEGNDLSNAVEYEEAMDDFAGSVRRSHSLWQRSFLKNGLQLLSRLAGDPKPSALPRSGLMPLGNGRSERVYFLYEGAELRPDQLEGLELTREALRKANRSCAEAGVHFVVAFAPTKYRVYRGMVEFGPASEPESWILNDLPRRLGDIVSEISPEISYVDLTVALRAAAEAGRMPFPRDEAHWSVAGHAAVAAALTAASPRASPTR